MQAVLWIRTDKPRTNGACGLSQRSADLYLDLIRSQIFCDDEHSVLARAKLKEVQQALSLQISQRDEQFCPRFIPELLGRKGPRLSRGTGARPANSSLWHHPPTLFRAAVPRQQRFRLVYGLFCLRDPDDMQKPLRFCGTKFVRNHGHSSLNHVFGRAASGPSRKYTTLSMARACSPIF